MGNQGSQLGDEPSGPNDSSASSNQRSLQYFDHTFKGELHTTVGALFTDPFGECKFAKRAVQVVCKAQSFEIIEDVGLTGRKQIEVQYVKITCISWDHSGSEVKIEVKESTSGPDCFVILTMANTIEFEGEMKLRLQNMAASVPGARQPSTMYVGMFAGASKPKPFQRKRPNISHLPGGKLPPLNEMRNSAIHLQKGSYRPCPPGESRRIDLAVQHIYEGFNSFGILRVKGPSAISNQWSADSMLQIREEGLTFKPYGNGAPAAVEFPFEDIHSWEVDDSEHIRNGDSGLEICSVSGDKVMFVVPFVRDIKHTMEFFWNKFKVENRGEVKLGSTHGRPLVSMATLSGELPAAPEAPVGNTEVVDQDGLLVRPGGKMARRASTVNAVSDMMGGSKEPKVVPPENREVRKHWHRVVMHQGWLLKKGGVGVGSVKNWIKRYFVLYATSQGHFLVYYSDFTECPLYSAERGYRNVVDLAKTTFIRPGSLKSDDGDTPPHSFDIVTIEREWTLCAESQENVQKWLKLLTRGVDEDVAILPDEELLFKVKPKVDPLGILPASDYSTSLRVSANGVSVCIPDTSQTQGTYSGVVKEKLGAVPEKEVYFWVYTDFYKWSLLSQGGKLALLVNVFADSSFSRRNEYIFRNKEAVRLATAIEYYIEKFMSVMHIRLETTEGAFDDVPVAEAVLADGPSASGGLHNVQADEWGASNEDELDLLGIEISSPSKTSAASNSNSNSNPFGNDDPFGERTSPSRPSAPAASKQAADPFGGDPFAEEVPVTQHHTPAPAPAPKPAQRAADPFGGDPFAEEVYAAPAPAPAPTPAPAPASKATAVLDLFGDDFGSTPAPTPAPAPAPAKQSAVLDLFGDAPVLTPAHAPAPTPAPVPKASAAAVLDLFGDSFGGPAPVAAPAGPKLAPPLTPQQIATHAQWLQLALMKNGGPLFDDGSLQISTLIEVRGSQGRVTFQFRNNSPASFSELNLSIEDPQGLTRFQLGPSPGTLGGLSQAQQQVMLECVKPTAPGPSVTISYVDSLRGKRVATLPLPLTVTSFNEPMSVMGPDFVTRWDQLGAPGLQAQEVFSPSQRIIPAQVASVLHTALKFGAAVGVPGDSEFVIHGASSLRTGALSPSGEKINIGCLVKLEMNVQSNAIRVTVRTLFPAASAAIMATARSLLN